MVDASNSLNCTAMLHVHVLWPHCARFLSILITVVECQL